MKKVRVLLAVFPALLSVFACDLHIPRKIEVQAAPDLKLKMEIDLGQEIKDKIRENIAGADRSVGFAKDYGVSGDDENMALVIRMMVFEMTEQQLCNAVNDISVTASISNVSSTKTIREWVKQAFPSWEGVTPQNIGEITGSNNTTMQTVLSVNIPKDEPLQNAIPEINEEVDGIDEIIKDFKLVDNSGDLFIYDEKPNSSFKNTLGYSFTVNGNENKTPQMYSIPTKYNNTNWDADEIDYQPGDGQDIYPLFEDNAMKAQFKVFLKQSTSVKTLLECVQNADVKVEIIAWIPLKFEAEKDNASFEIPVDLGSGDLFQRKKGEKDVLVVKEMNITILFSDESFNKTFKGKEMVITNGDLSGFSITYTLENEYVEIKFNKAQMLLINGDPKHNPFSPLINIKFKEKNRLVIPWELKTLTVGFYADLAAVVDL